MRKHYKFIFFFLFSFSVCGRCFSLLCFLTLNCETLSATWSLFILVYRAGKDLPQACFYHC
uniref:Predicted protein n=1 Tax=Hordeum vulgare subsp. vulgare TaxID=112509 RepID=F2D7R8_HORVV|nr:predicted protein [Hordeum vulgare subsp. vulgare]